jgi:DNA-binding NarL/FixJ family response regulator
MLKNIKQWEIDRIRGIMHMQSLDAEVEDSDGELVPFHETVGNSDDAKFITLKCFLLNVAQTKAEKQIIELLSQQYAIADIAKRLHRTKNNIRYTIYTLRKRCQEHGFVIKPKKRKSA